MMFLLFSPFSFTGRVRSPSVEHKQNSITPEGNQFLIVVIMEHGVFDP